MKNVAWALGAFLFLTGCGNRPLSITKLSQNTPSITLNETEDGEPDAFQAPQILRVLSAARFQNRRNPRDVNGDGAVTAADANSVMDYLNSDGPKSINENVNLDKPYDVNGDNFISPIDALIIINELNRPSGDPYVRVPISIKLDFRDHTTDEDSFMIYYSNNENGPWLYSSVTKQNETGDVMVRLNDISSETRLLFRMEAVKGDQKSKMSGTFTWNLP